MELKIVEVMGVKKLNWINGSDTFCEIRSSSCEITQKTRTITNTLHPVWNEIFDVVIDKDEPFLSVISIALFAQRSVLKPLFMGRIEIPIATLCATPTRQMDVWFPLLPRNSVHYGSKNRLHINTMKIHVEMKMKSAPIRPPPILSLIHISEPTRPY
eukprot:TRINITY_DN5271_c0_g1_i1.p1 TRINITY_DN5271_c0_g1~~TRINITY_DN5271_c0_g1_i1.p1  ORF type:complete len:157 (-),score=1.27 TRINITY_DN5271_c0_g1_i1:18-488(-)